VLRLLALALLLGACTSSGPSGPVFVFEGMATMQSYQLVSAAPAQVDDSQAPVVSVPTQGQAYLDTDAPPPFRWSAALANGAPPATADSGAVFVLTFTLPGGGTVIGVTIESSFTPDAEAWDVLKHAGGTINLEIVGAVLAGGQLTRGPFKASAPRRFSVKQTFWP